LSIARANFTQCLEQEKKLQALLVAMGEKHAEVVKCLAKLRELFLYRLTNNTINLSLFQTHNTTTSTSSAANFVYPKVLPRSAPPIWN
jgi:hypothetical protein